MDPSCSKSPRLFIGDLRGEMSPLRRGEVNMNRCVWGGNRASRNKRQTGKKLPYNFALVWHDKKNTVSRLTYRGLAVPHLVFPPQRVTLCLPSTLSLPFANPQLQWTTFGLPNGSSQSLHKLFYLECLSFNAFFSWLMPMRFSKFTFPEPLRLH